MTVLRRMAQLVSDLRELGVIVEGDTIAYEAKKVGSMWMSINLEESRNLSKEIDLLTIENSIKEEFPEADVFYIDFLLNVSIIPKKS